MADVSRRQFLGTSLRAATAAPFVLRHSYRVFAQSTREYPERVVRLMRESLVIDMLNQFLYRIDQRATLEKWLTEPGAFTEADFLRFKSTGVNVINFGNGARDFPGAQLLFSRWNAFIEQYPQWLIRITNATDLARAREQGRFGILFGLQSSGQFEGLDDIDRCYMSGQRISQLSYNSRTAVADGAYSPRTPGSASTANKSSNA